MLCSIYTKRAVFECFFFPQSRQYVYGSGFQEQHLQFSTDWLRKYFCVLGFSLFPLPQYGCNELFFIIVESRFFWHLSQFLKKWHWCDLLWFYEYAEWWGGISILRRLKIVCLKGRVISAVILMEAKIFWNIPL